MPPDPSHTAFVLVPGGFCPGAFWDKVSALLRARGHPVVEIDHPSVGRTPAHPPPTVHDDAAHVRSAVTALADRGLDVVVAANSYGGFVATEAARGVSRRERAAAGLPGAQTRLVYLGSLLPPVGANIQELVGGKVPVDTSATAAYNEPPEADAVMGLICSELGVEERRRYGTMLAPQSAAAFVGRITHAGYESVPVTFVVTGRDLVLEPRLMHESADAAIAAGKGDIRKVVLESDHCGMISHPEEVAEILVEAAGVASG